MSEKGRRNNCWKDSWKLYRKIVLEYMDDGIVPDAGSRYKNLNKKIS